MKINYFSKTGFAKITVLTLLTITLLTSTTAETTYTNDDINLVDDLDEFNEGDILGVWGEEDPLETENLTIDGPFDEGEKVELGVVFRQEGDDVRFGEELDFFSTTDGEDYQKLTDYEFLNRHLGFEDGEYYFTVPSVDLGDSPGVQTGDKIQVEDRASETIVYDEETDLEEPGELAGSNGEIWFKTVREEDAVNETVFVDQEPLDFELSKESAEEIEVSVFNNGDSPIDSNQFWDDGELDEDLFDFDAQQSRIGGDNPAGEFALENDEGSSIEFSLELDKGLQYSDDIVIELSEDVDDLAGNTLDSGLLGTVEDMNEQAPEIEAEAEFFEDSSTIGSQFALTVWTRSVEDVEQVEVDLSSINSDGLVTKDDLEWESCGNEWNECYTVEFEEIQVEYGSDGLNELEVTSIDSEDRENTEKLDLEIDASSQTIEEVEVFDKEGSEFISAAEVVFDTDVDEETVNEDHWTLHYGEMEYGVEEDGVDIEGSSAEILFEIDGELKTTDPSEVEVTHQPDIDDDDYLLTESGAKVAPLNKGQRIEQDGVAPTALDYELQEEYNKGLLTYSEPLTSLNLESDEDYHERAFTVQDSSTGAILFNNGVSSPGDGEEVFEVEGNDSDSSEEVSRSEFDRDGKDGFLVLEGGWNIVSLPTPGSVVQSNDQELGEDEVLEDLDCVDNTYRRMGSWDTGVEDLSHVEGTFVEASSECVLFYEEDYSEDDLVSPKDLIFNDDDDLEEGWNLVSPFENDDGTTQWIDNEDLIEPDSTIIPTDTVEDLDEEDIEDVDSVNSFDSYWVDNR